VLWLVSAIVARKTARPIRHLVDVAKRIGDGDLRARPQVGRRAVLEVRALADALGEMADRIETQLKDQRALLAGASHEMRTPLGHLRILVELLRQQPSDKVISDVEREVVEMDALIEKLLASSRLDFSLADKRDVDCADLARRALERSGEPVAKLNIVDDTNTHVHGDPTLLLGAVTNLVENAKSHGIELVALTVEQRGDELAFIVDDKGPGIAAEDADKVFEPFFHRARGDGAQGSLGLGLSLVKRIAEAHGGRAFAASHDDAPGARVGFTVLRG
jgi:signal transduction histidine kinase